MLLLIGTAFSAVMGGAGVLVACRLLQGAGFSAATTAAATAASDILPESRLGEGLGYYGLGQALALSIGPAMALFLVSTEPPENLYLGLGAVAVLAVPFAALCRYERNPQRLPETSAYRLRCFGGADQLSETGSNSASVCCKLDREGKVGVSRHCWGIFEKRALPGAFTLLVIRPAFGFGLFFMGSYGADLGIQGAGMFYTASAISMVAVRLVSGSLMDRVDPFKMMAFAVGCGLCAFGMSLTAPWFNPLFCLAGIPYGLCQGIVIPLNQAVSVKNTPQRRWGAANAMYLLANDIGIGAASMIWGFINDSFGFSVAIVCVMGCIAASLAAARAVYPNCGVTGRR